MVFLVYFTLFFLHTLLVLELTNKKNAAKHEIYLSIRRNYENNKSSYNIIIVRLAINTSKCHE